MTKPTEATPAEAPEVETTREPYAIPAPGPGLYPGVPMETYLRWNVPDQSALKLIADAPARWPAHVAALECDEPETLKEHFQIGTAFHTATLEPDRYADTVAVMPALNLRTNAGKAERAAFILKHKGKTILTAEQAATVVAMRDGVRRCKSLSALLDFEGACELSGIADIPLPSGRVFRLKVRFDKLVFAGTLRAVLDMKTTADCSEAEFSRSVFNFGYHVQGAAYLDAAAYFHTSGMIPECPDGFVFGCCEKEAPYLSRAFLLDATAASEGRREFYRLAERFAECSEANDWPGYPDEICTVTLPKWAFQRTVSA